jgi:hypothetical protein
MTVEVIKGRLVLPFVYGAPEGKSSYLRFTVVNEREWPVPCVAFGPVADALSHKLTEADQELFVVGRKKLGEIMVDQVTFPSDKAIEAVKFQSKARKQELKDFWSALYSQGQVKVTRDGVQMAWLKDDCIAFADGSYTPIIDFCMDCLGGDYVTKYLRERVTLDWLKLPSKTAIKGNYPQARQELLKEAKAAYNNELKRLEEITA